jgi:perosamine synthetase
LNRLIPYGHQCIDEDDIQAVVKVLKSDWITTGPAIEAFEKSVAEFVGAEYGTAVSSGTAALHTAVYASGIKPGDEVIVPAMTFAATANAVVFQGATPVFCDIDARTLLIDANLVESKVGSKTRAIIAVDYAGQPCNYDAIREIADRNKLILIADACHSLGATYSGRKVGTLADLTVFSFHPVKHITTGEGGMVVTDNPEYCRRMHIFRNHGITTDHRHRSERGSWFYEMVDLGYNYRITDFQCALGMSQLKKLPGWIERRQKIASRYDEAFSGLDAVEPLAVASNVSHVYHLYVVKLQGIERDKVFNSLREAGIGANVHYIPVHLHPFYNNRFGTKKGLCPVAEAAYEQILSLPMFPVLTDEDVDMVVSAVKEAVS